ncbi:unnamed protein product [Paramecium octaurelia]|uniref:RING-type domain-containing protein n=1 Tax=Paramecium octaurelia TaxID=43137 RepID=A0A8S1XNW5_PAROT|nr:unnamed protein product [Paramecium octaurelia]
MLNNLRDSQQNNYQSQLENSLSNQVQQAFQSTVQFRVISFLLYFLMVLIVITLLISIVVANKYRQSQQLLLVGILMIPLLIVLFGCTLYVQLQFSDAKERLKKVPQEKQLNRWMYQSSITFFFFYTNQSQFTAIRLTYLYIVFAIFILIRNVSLLSKDEYSDDEDYKDLDETNNNDRINYQTKPEIRGNLLLSLIIFCSVLAFLFFIYEALKIVLTIYLKCRNRSVLQYQYTDVNLIIRWSKAFCGLFLVNHIGKMMILCTIFITPNSSSYVLIGSNIYYHFFMATLVNALFNEISSIQRPPQNDSSLFINHQVLIDSKLRSMQTKKAFQLLLITSFIFTIVGTCMFRIQIDTFNGILNFDIFILYDCSIVQLILLGLAIMKYLVIPQFNRENVRVYHTHIYIYKFLFINRAKLLINYFTIFYQSQLENSLSNQVQQAFQSTVQFRVISFLLYFLMVLIVITLLISIVVANKYRQSQQLLLVGILMIPLLIVLFGCTLYVQLQFSDAKERLKKVPQEKQLNRWMYQSSITFFFFYTNQSQFTAIRLTYLYIVFAIFILIRNVSLLSKDEYSDDEDYKDLDETNNNDRINYQTKPEIRGNLLLSLIIFCSVLAFLFFIYEALKIVLTIYLKCRNRSVLQYQYTDVNLIIRWSKAFCGLFLVNHIGKMMILCTIFITPNSSSYVLIGSNIYYHFFMATLVNALFNEISSIQRPPQNDSSLFINHQVLIDSKLRSMQTKKAFQLLLITSFIFTIVGTCMFRIQIDTFNGILNFDIFILYDCSIVQLILLGLAIMKYLVIPQFNRENVRIVQQQQAQAIEDQQLQTIENQQVRLSTEQAQLDMILRSQNDEIYENTRNRPPFKKVKNLDFVIQNENEKCDCIICLQPMVLSSDDPLLQLNCHSTHIFHKKCITDWLVQNKKCPLCNTQIL